MNFLRNFKRWQLAISLIFILSHTLHAQQDVVTYIGKGGNGVVNKEYFQNALLVNSANPVYDSTVLIVGAADNLEWVPPGTPIRSLANVGNINSSSGSLNANTTGQNFAFILHLSRDLQTPLSLVHFPVNTAHDIGRLRTTTVPNEHMDNSVLYISGRRAAPGAQDGYYIARLNYNFTSPLPASVSAQWLVNIDCFQTDDEHETLQPWDVGGDGKVVYAHGQSLNQSSTARAFVKRLKANGTPDVVPNWFLHYRGNTSFFRTSSQPGDESSAIFMKAGNVDGSLRSTSQRQFDTLMVDENGNPGRKSAFPDDYFYNGPNIPGGTRGGNGGYTAYTHDDRTHRIGSIAIDKRNNSFYIGYCVKSNLPSGLPDFEPALTAMDSTGRLVWWRRTYRETDQNSPPDQWVDAVEVDYYNNMVLVICRAAGNAPDNHWSGNDLFYNPTARGYVNRFTGQGAGSAIISWMGKYTLNLGRIMHATYIAEYSNGTGGLGARHSDPNMDGWPDPNSGWPSTNTTLTSYNKINISRGGSVYLTGIGRRVVTTLTAFQKMIKPDRALPLDSNSAWSWFARVYDSDLSRLRYSTLLTGQWDPITQRGSDNTNLATAIPVLNGMLVVGQHRNAETANPSSLASRPNRIPTANPPGWTSNNYDTAYGQTAILAKLGIPPQRILPLVQNQTFCRRLLSVQPPNWVVADVPMRLPGDYAYNADNLFTVSLIDSLGTVISDSTIAGRQLNSLRLNIPPWAAIASNYRLTISASSPITMGDTVRVNIADGPPDSPFLPFGNTNDLCVNGTSVFKTYRVPLASSYRWRLSNNDAGTLSGTDTTVTVIWDPTYNSDNDPVRDTVSIFVSGVNLCGESLPSQRLFITLTNACLQVGSGVSGGTYCPLTNITVPFVAPNNLTFRAGNKFMVQVSDADGNFSSPVVGGGDIIGSIDMPVSDSTGRQINNARRRIPCFLPFGLAGPVRIRVVATNPNTLGGEVTININELAEPPTQPRFIPGYGKLRENGTLDTDYPRNISATDNQGSGVNICSFGNQQDRPGGCQVYPSTSPFGCGSYRRMIYTTTSVPGALSYRWTIDPPAAGVIQGFAGVDTAAIVAWDTTFAGGPVSIYVTAVTNCIGLTSLPIVVNVANCAPINSVSNSFNADTSFCAGTTFSVNIPLPPFAPPAVSAPRELLIQLSDQNGSFANPVLVGRMDRVTLPGTLPASDNYRLRVWGGTTNQNGGLSPNRPLFYGNPIRIRVRNPLTPPATPVVLAPLGPGMDSVCTVLNGVANPATHVFRTAGVAGAMAYAWSITPASAGQFVGNTSSDTARVAWTPGFIGTAYLSVRGINVCGQGAASGLISINLGYKGAPGSPCGIPVPLEPIAASYRTKASGTGGWNQLSNWESCPGGNCDVNAPDMTGGWVAAGAIPLATNSSRIFIRNRTVTDLQLNTSTRFISRLRIEPSGTLEVANQPMNIMVSNSSIWSEAFGTVVEGGAPPTGWTRFDADDQNVDQSALCNIGHAGQNDDNPTPNTIQCGGTCLGKSSWFGRGGKMWSPSIYENQATADNWLVTNAVNLTAGNYMYWQGFREGRNNIALRCSPCATNCGQTQFQNSIRYQVRVFTVDPATLSSDSLTLVTNSTLLGTFTESGNTIGNRNVDLRAYAGRQVWLAFRHITQGYALMSIDNLSIGAPTSIDLDIAGTLINGFERFNGLGGDITISTTPIKGVVRSTGRVIHDRDGGVLPICTWEPGSTLELRGLRGAMPGNMGLQSFYNVTFNNTGQTGSLFINDAVPLPQGTIRLPALQAGGKLRIQNTNGRVVYLTTSTNVSMALSKLQIDGGILAICGGESGIRPIQISDSLIIRGGTFLATNDYRPQATTVNLAGHFLMTGGEYDFSNGSNPQFWLPSFLHRLNVAGDFILEGGLLRQSYQGAIGTNGVVDRIRSQVVFNGSSLQRIKATGTIGQEGVEFVLDNSGAGIELLSDVNVPRVLRVSWDGSNRNFIPTRSFTHRRGNINLNGFTMRTANYSLGSVGVLGSISGSGQGLIIADTMTMGGIINNSQNRILINGWGPGALAGTPDSNSYIVGGLRRNLLAFSPADYIFPVARQGSYRAITFRGLRTTPGNVQMSVMYANGGAQDAAPDRLKPFSNLPLWRVTKSGTGTVAAVRELVLVSDSLTSASRIGQDTASTTGADPDAVYTNLGGNLPASARFITNEKPLFLGSLNRSGATTHFTLALPGFMPATVTIGNDGTYKNLTEFSKDYNSLELNQPVTALFREDYDGDTTNTRYPEVFPIIFKQNVGKFPVQVVNNTNKTLVTAGADKTNAEIIFEGADNLTFHGDAGGGKWLFRNRKITIEGPIRSFSFRNDATFNTLRGLDIEINTSIAPFPKVIPRGSCPWTKVFYEIKNLYNPSIAFYVPCPGKVNRPYPYANNPLGNTGLAQRQILGGNIWNSTLPAPDGDGDTSYNARTLQHNACLDVFNTDRDYRPEPPRALIKPINPGFTCDCLPNPAFPRCPAGTPNCNYAADYRSQNQQKIDCSPPTTALPPNMRPPCPVEPDTVGMMARYWRQWNRWIEDSTRNAVYVRNYAVAKRYYDSLSLAIRRALYQLSVDQDETAILLGDSPDVDRNGDLVGNSFNTIENCEIRGANTNAPKGELRGYAWGITSMKRDFNGSLNMGNRILNNRIFNFRFRGIDVNETGNGGNWRIQGNSLYNTNPGGCRFSATATALRFVPGGQSEQDTISGNFIGGTAANASGDPMIIPLGWNLSAIDVNVGGTASTPSFITENVIRNIKNYSLGYPEDQSSGARCIQVSSGVVNVDRNQVGRYQDTLNLGRMDIIFNNSNARVTINDNRIINIFNVTGGIRYVGTGAVDISRNLVDNLYAADNWGPVVAGIYLAPGTSNITVNDNVITGIKYFSGRSVAGIYVDKNSQRRGSNGQVARNTIHSFSLTNPGDGFGGNVFGIRLAPNFASGTGWQVYNNSVVLNNPSIGLGNESSRSRNSFQYGIMVDSVTAGKVGIIHNSVLLSGLGSVGNYAFLRSGAITPELRVRNNIFMNQRSGYAIGTNRPFDWAPAMSNYNLLAAVDTNLIGNFAGPDKGFKTWRETSQGDANSWAFIADRTVPANHSFINAAQLFVAPDAGNLRIRTTDSTGWHVNTRGAAGPEGGEDYLGDNIKFDQENRPRSADSPVGYLSRWGADLGAYEVKMDSSIRVPMALPDVLNARSLTGTTQFQRFVYGGRDIATLNWVGTANVSSRPTRMDLRYSPGIDPDGSIMQRRYFLAKWDIASGDNTPLSSLGLRVAIHYDKNVQARVENNREPSIKVARNLANSRNWRVYRGTVNLAARQATMTDTTARLGKFALTDSLDQIPVNPVDTVDICSGIPTRLFRTPRPIYNYTWAYGPAPGVFTFDTLDPNPLITIVRQPNTNGIYRFVVVGQNPVNPLIKTVDTLIVRVAPTPIPQVGQRNVSICSGTSGIIGVFNDPANRYVFGWKLPPGLTGDTSLSQTVVTITNPDTSLRQFTAVLFMYDTVSGCFGTDTVFISALPNPVVDLGQDTLKICANTNRIISPYTGRAGYSYEWSPATGLSSITLPNPTVNLTQPGLYKYVLLVGIGATTCISRDSIWVKVLGTPQNAAGPGKRICSGDTTFLGFSGLSNEYTYSWSPTTGLSNPNAPNPILTLTNTTGQCETVVYTLTMRSLELNCVGTSQVAVTVCPKPVADAGPDATICSGVSSTVGTTGVAGNTYLWKGHPSIGADSALAQPTITIRHQGNDTLRVRLFVQVTNASNCSATDTVVLKILPEPSVSAGPDQLLCAGATSVLGVPSMAGITYAWSPGTYLDDTTLATPRITTPVGNILQRLTYVLRATSNQTGCFTTDTVVVTVKPQPELPLGNVNTACSGEAIILGGQGPAGFTYNWQLVSGRGNIVPGTSAFSTATFRNTGLVDSTYTLRLNVRDTAGCESSALLNITVKPEPLSTAGADVTVCDSSLVNLGKPSVAGETYLWSGRSASRLNSVSSSSPVFLARNLGSTTIKDTLIVSTTNTLTGCRSTDTVVVTIQPKVITPAIVQRGITVCPGTQGYLFTLAQQPAGYTYQWRMSPGFGILTSAGEQATVNFNTNLGQLYVYVTATANGCIGKTDSALVTLTNQLRPVIRGVTSTSICSREAARPTTYRVDLVAGSSYTWGASGGAQIVAGGNSNIVTITMSGSGRIWVQETNGACSGVSDTTSFSVFTSPDSTKQISGPAVSCAGALSVQYSFLNVPGRSTIGWTIPTGLTYTVLQRQDSSILTLNAPAAGIYTLTAQEFDTVSSGVVCPGKVISKQISVESLPLVAIAAFDSVLCPTGLPVSYSASSTNLAARFRWQVTGGSIVGDSTLADVNVVWDASAPQQSLSVVAISAGGCQGPAITKRLSKDSTLVEIEYLTHSEQDELVLQAYIRTRAADPLNPAPIFIEQRVAGSASWQTVRQVPAGVSSVVNLTQTSLPDTAIQVRLRTVNSCGTVVTSPVHNTMYLRGKAVGKGATMGWNLYPAAPGFTTGSLLRRKDDETSMTPYAENLPLATGATILANNGPDGFVQRFRLNSSVNGRTLWSNTVTLEYENKPAIGNAWTPNNDGVNDLFYVENLELYPQNQLIVYNRYGVVVYQTTDYRNNWTGADLPSGTYYYHFTTRRGPALKGWIEVLK